MDLTAFDLKGKVALVTGGAHGIGFSIAEGMAKCGATVCFNCSNEGSLEKGLAAYKAAGIDAHGYVADVTDEAAVNAMIAQIKAEVGPVDILANDAGLHGEHMRMDFIVEMFHGIPRKIVEVIALLLVLAMLGVLFVGGIELVQGTWPMLTSALRIPKGAVYLCAPIGFGYMFIQTLVKLYKAITYSDEKLENADKEAE